MKKINELVLKRLLEKYESSKVSKGTNEKKISIKLNFDNDTLLKNLFDLKEAKNIPFYIEELNKIEYMGFVKIKREYSTMESIELNIDKVNDIYKYLNIKNPSDIYDEIYTYLETKKYDSFLNDFVLYVKDKISKRNMCPLFFKDLDELRLLLTALENLIKLENEIMERDFSVQYLHDSKLFTSIRNKIIKVLKIFDPSCPVNYNDDDILSYYNIVKNSTYAMIKCGLTIKIGNQVINLDDLGYEMSLSDKMINDLIILNCKSNKLVTVENLTSFYKLNTGAIIIYLGGFHNHTKRMLLTKIHDKFPELEYYHFGDIDAGGFYIFNDLKEKTGINFKPFKMGIEELEENKDKLKSLTENDINRLNQMLTNPKFNIFKEIIKYMLEHNVKLEQEILD